MIIVRGIKRKQFRHRQSLKPNTEITDKGGTVWGMGIQSTAPMTTAAGVPQTTEDDTARPVMTMARTGPRREDAYYGRCTSRNRKEQSQ